MNVVYYRVELDEPSQQRSIVWCSEDKLPKVGDVIRIVGGLKARVTEIVERKEPARVRAEPLD